MIQQKMVLGIDSLLIQRKKFKGKKVALLCNESSVTSDGEASRSALLRNGFTLIKLFSPEHGLRSIGDDGQYQAHGKDALTGLPIISLYGDILAPREEDLHDTDLLISDLPDIGCRFYTYLWTMTHVMESCEKFNIPMLISDRPNPIATNFAFAEGPMLAPSCASFIGRWNIPLKHNCTIAELARYFKNTYTPKLQLDIISLQQWKRESGFAYPFLPTSPAMQSLHAACLYPGTGLLEGIYINEGRGTPHPFEQFGAPWIDAADLKSLTDTFDLPHIKTHTITYTPESGLYAHEKCYGLFLEIADPAKLKSVETGIMLIKALCTLYPEKIRERFYETVANPDGVHHLDKLLGIPDALVRIKKQEFIETDLHENWKNVIADYLLY
jgi:uncharacterized protein YbbC (DUF1343 family)